MHSNFLQKQIKKTTNDTLDNSNYRLLYVLINGKTAQVAVCTRIKLQITEEKTFIDSQPQIKRVLKTGLIMILIHYRT